MARPKKQAEKTRKDGNYEAKVTIGKDMHGKPIRKSFYSTVSVADAKKKGEEYRIQREIETRSGSFIADDKMTFGKWAEKWLEVYKKPNVSARTYYSSYHITLKVHLIPYFGAAELTSIRNADIQAYISSQSHKSESHLKKVVIVLKQIFDAAIENDLCFKNPARKIKINSSHVKDPRRVYTPEQIETVCKHTKMLEMIVMLKLGLRRGEVVGLMWSDIDLENGTLSVNRSVADVPIAGEPSIEIVPPKKSSFRTIPLSNELIKLFEKIPKKSLYVFPNRNGAVASPNSWCRRFDREMARLSREYGVPAFRSHELRHTAGTDMARRGVDIFTIQKILGHKDIKMTTNLYVHDEVDRLRDALKRANLI